MRTLASLLVIGVSGALAACGNGDGSGPSDDQTRPARSATPQPARSPTRQAPVIAEGQLGRPETVSAQANIFGAGQDEPPAPAGGGPGVLPPVWRLQRGSERVVTFPSVTGRVNPIVDSATANGPGGDRVGPTDVTSYGGISGIVHRRNGMFLVGVFLTDDPPSKHAPPRLNFTRRERFNSLAPRIAQTFLIGNGKGRSYRVPARATRLFVGFADGYLYDGAPGWYGNNAGQLTVTVDMTRR
jgi:hypothetical protein